MKRRAAVRIARCPIPLDTEVRCYSITFSLLLRIVNAIHEIDAMR